MPPAVSQRWSELKQRGAFEQDKAELSLMCLPENIKRIAPRTMADVLRNDTPTLATVRKYQGEDITEQTVAAMIFELATYINAGKGLTIPQVSLIADHVCAEYYFLTLADIALFVRMSATGKFGEVYDRLDVQVLSKWLAAYCEMRTSMAADFSAARHKNIVSENAVPMPPEMSAWLAARLPPEKSAKPVFEVDDAILATIRAEYDAMPEDLRPTFDKYKSLRCAQIRAMAAN